MYFTWHRILLYTCNFCSKILSFSKSVPVLLEVHDVDIPLAATPYLEGEPPLLLRRSQPVLQNVDLLLQDPPPLPDKSASVRLHPGAGSKVKATFCQTGPDPKRPEPLECAVLQGELYPGEVGDQDPPPGIGPDHGDSLHVGQPWLVLTIVTKPQGFPQLCLLSGDGSVLQPLLDGDNGVDALQPV